VTGQGEVVYNSKRDLDWICFFFVFFFFIGDFVEVLAQVAQRGIGCPIPADTQGQAGWGYEHLIEL